MYIHLSFYYFFTDYLLAPGTGSDCFEESVEKRFQKTTEETNTKLFLKKILTEDRLEGTIPKILIDNWFKEDAPALFSQELGFEVKDIVNHDYLEQDDCIVVSFDILGEGGYESDENRGIVVYDKENNSFAHIINPAGMSDFNFKILAGGEPLSIKISVNKAGDTDYKVACFTYQDGNIEYNEDMTNLYQKFDGVLTRDSIISELVKSN